MQDGGLFVIETENRQVARPFEINGETVEPGEYIVLSVTDSGMGIDFVTLPRVFEPFFTTKEVGSVTGLGLSTVYGIVTQTGGHILAESEGAGQGTGFKIYFRPDKTMSEELESEVIKAARVGDPDLPVICMSGYTQESIAREVESMDNVDFLPKPFSLKQLAVIVKLSHDRSRKVATKSVLTN